MKRTPLYEAHRRLNAKLVEFGGWEMPLQYTSIIEEHKIVRSSVGIFDVSHMGEIEIRGPRSLELLQKLITNDAATLQEYQVLYSPMCYESGGTVDDLLVYKRPDHYLLVVNAANVDKDCVWVRQNAATFSQVEIRNASAEHGQIAIQGPQAGNLFQPFVECDLKTLKYYWAAQARVLGTEALVSRTGYTGEDGFEVYGSPDVVSRLWEELLRAGAEPIGLGARDTLRFEASYPLYGHELGEYISPIEAGLGWTVKDKTADYNGKRVLLGQKRHVAPRKLIGLKMLESSVPRQGYKIFAENQEVGVITSGMLAPALDAFLAMGLVSTSTPSHSPNPTRSLPVNGEGQGRGEGLEVEVEIRGQRKRAQIVKLPFYRGSVKR